MPNASGGVAVIATQVARSDRRALSEAWYSALHLAHRTPAGYGATRRCAAGQAPMQVAHRRERSEPHGPVAQPVEPARKRTPSERPNSVPAHVERRRPASETALRVERALTALAARPAGYVAQTVEVAGGRVRLLVRTDRSATRIVAVCSAPLREPVERALAQARFLLARGGFSVGAP